MPHGTERATHQERALVSPCAPGHHARHPLGKGSSVVTCPEAPSPSPGRRGLQSHHVPYGSRPAPCARRLWRRHVTEASGPPPAGLRYRHVFCGSRPTSWCRRTPEPPRAQWLSASGHVRAFPRCLKSGPSWSRQARGAGSALNVYVAGQTQRMIGIKYIQDIDVARRR
jgi:hypothetical protein